MSDSLTFLKRTMVLATVTGLVAAVPAAAQGPLSEGYAGPGGSTQNEIGPSGIVTPPTGGGDTTVAGSDIAPSTPTTAGDVTTGEQVDAPTVAVAGAAPPTGDVSTAAVSPAGVSTDSADTPSPARPAASRPVEGLPFTGADISVIAAVGGALLLLGFGLMALTRRGVTRDMS